MSAVCRACLMPLEPPAEYHPRCLRRLFDSTKVPHLDVAVGKLHTAALAMVGHTSLSGIQKKISVGLSADRETLQVASGGGRYILKPQTEAYPYLPENEHLTTQLARLLKIEVAPNALVALPDGSWAFVVRRFDRPAQGNKLLQEDFCQLAELAPKQKYEGSAELCVRLLRRFASEPLVEIQKLYRQFLLAWWTGNGDLHLKNLSLLTGTDGLVRLTPAYDLVCTRLVIAGDPLALPIVGKKDRLDRADWLQFARYAELPERLAQRLLAEPAAALDEALRLVAASPLPEEMRQAYAGLLAERAAVLASGGRAR